MDYQVVQGNIFHIATYFKEYLFVDWEDDENTERAGGLKEKGKSLGGLLVLRMMRKLARCFSPLFHFISSSSPHPLSHLISS